eukprot:Sdes_comp14057_c0_seq2m3375
MEEYVISLMTVVTIPLPSPWKPSSRTILLTTFRMLVYGNVMEFPFPRICCWSRTFATSNGFKITEEMEQAVPDISVITTPLLYKSSNDSLLLPGFQAEICVFHSRFL